MTALEIAFWLAAAATVYTYFAYPLLLAALDRLRPAPPAPNAGGPPFQPTVTVIIPVHNEERAIGAKLQNTVALDYPSAALQVVVVSDGSTDGTAGIVRAVADPRIELVELGSRQGKAAGLNAGLQHARHEIVVFTDAAIALEPQALTRLVAPFARPEVGCVSGEDRIAHGGGEGLYGRYELWLRRQESRLHSIVGASGSIYAQRRSLCSPFVPQLAPDFLSVLRTVEQGSRAVVASDAVGYMEAVSNPRDEFERKVRTLLRGLTTLGRFPHLLNPLRYGAFAIFLLSHKLMRWLVPVFLIVMLLASGLLATRSAFYAGLFGAQLLFYALGYAAYHRWVGVESWAISRIASYFVSVNVATLVAWFKYAVGVRQELWSPSRR
jgi:cellulose synthase/poly-beta-1,6-N-acetylglucosamine synthase-like glycosyltransferase